MTPEERAAIEARDARWVEQCGWDPPWKPSPDDWDSDAMPDRHALLDELRRVEAELTEAKQLLEGVAPLVEEGGKWAEYFKAQRDRAMALCQEIDNLIVHLPYEGCEKGYAAWRIRRNRLKREIDGEKEKSGGR